MKGLLANGEVFKNMQSGLLSTGLPRNKSQTSQNNNEGIDSLFTDIMLNNAPTCMTPITIINVGNPFILSNLPAVIANELYDENVSTCTRIFGLLVNLEDLITEVHVCTAQLPNIKINYV